MKYSSFKGESISREVVRKYTWYVVIIQGYKAEFLQEHLTFWGYVLWEGAALNQMHLLRIISALVTGYTVNLKIDRIKIDQIRTLFNYTIVKEYSTQSKIMIFAQNFQYNRDSLWRREFKRLDLYNPSKVKVSVKLNLYLHNQVLGMRNSDDDFNQ